MVNTDIRNFVVWGNRIVMAFSIDGKCLFLKESLHVYHEALVVCA